MAEPNSELENGQTVNSEVLVQLQADLEATKKALEDTKNESQRNSDTLLTRLEAAENALVEARKPKDTSPVALAEIEEVLKNTDSAIVEYHRKVVAPAESRMLKQLQDARVSLQREVAEARNEIRMEAEIRRAEKAHPDFDQYQDTMIDISKKNPSLNIETLYKMAKLDVGERNTAIEKEKEKTEALKLKLRSERPGHAGPGLGTKTTDIKSGVDTAFEQLFNADGTPK